MTLFTADVIRKLDRLEIVARKQLHGRLNAQRIVRRRGGSTEFADHRAYIPGDDLRYVDWSIYMRSGELFLKQFEAEEDVELLLLLDRSRSMVTRTGDDPKAAARRPSSSADLSMSSGRHPSKLDQGRLLCGALGYVSLATLDAVRLVSFDRSPRQSREAYRGRGLAHQLLDEIEHLEPGSEATDLVTSLEGVLTQRRGRGVAVLVSDLNLPPRQLDEALRRVRAARWQPFVLHLVDPEDRAPPVRGRTILVDAETGRSRKVAVTRKLLDGYRTFLERRDELLRQCANRNSAGYARVPVQQPFESVILELLRHRGLVR